LLLLSLAALNMPQAMVLCIADDGRMAIEPAGHGHCADGSHVCDHGQEADGHSHIGRQHCRPCVDIPIAVGTGDDRIVSQRSKSAPHQVASFQPAIQMPDVFEAPGTAEFSSFWLLSFCGSPPRCIILQV